MVNQKREIGELIESWSLDRDDLVVVGNKSSVLITGVTDTPATTGIIDQTE